MPGAKLVCVQARPNNLHLRIAVTRNFFDISMFKRHHLRGNPHRIFQPRHANITVTNSHVLRKTANRYGSRDAPFLDTKINMRSRTARFVERNFSNAKIFVVSSTKENVSCASGYRSLRSSHMVLHSYPCRLDAQMCIALLPR